MFAGFAVFANLQFMAHYDKVKALMTWNDSA